MAKVYSLGLMEEDMKVTTTMIRNKARVCLFGQMAESTKVTGTMESNMEKESITHRSKKSKKVSGKKERELGGSLTEFSTFINSKFLIKYITNYQFYFISAISNVYTKIKDRLSFEALSVEWYSYIIPN